METTLQNFQAHPSEYLSRALAGEEVMLTEQGKSVLRLVPVAPEKSPEALEQEALKRLRALPWIRPGNGETHSFGDPLLRIGPEEQSASDIVSEMRG